MQTITQLAAPSASVAAGLGEVTEMPSGAVSMTADPARPAKRTMPSASTVSRTRSARTPPGSPTVRVAVDEASCSVMALCRSRDGLRSSESPSATNPVGDVKVERSGCNQARTR